MTPNELDTLLEVLQKRGVRTYQIKSKDGVEFRLELAPTTVPTVGPATEERKPTEKEIERERERLLYAATEGYNP